jgi:hypothetical protein
LLLALVYTYRQGRVEFEYLSDWVKIFSASGGEADGRPGMFADSGRKMILSTTVTGFQPGISYPITALRSITAWKGKPEVSDD